MAKRAAGEQFNNHLEEKLLSCSDEAFPVQQTPADAQIGLIQMEENKSKSLSFFLSSRGKSTATELFKLTVYFSTQ